MNDRYYAWCPECRERTVHKWRDVGNGFVREWASQCTQCDSPSPQEAVEAYNEMCVEHLEQQWAVSREMS
jgi:hypothetical protein